MQSIGDNANQVSSSITGEQKAGVGSVRFVLPRFLRRPYRLISRFADGGFTVPRTIWLGLFIVALGSSAIAGWVTQNSNVSILSSVGSRAGFQISEVQFHGNKRVTAAEMEQTLGVRLDATLFDFDAEDARDALLANPWIKSANVVKVYPDVVTMEIIEREPFAIWQEGQEVRLVSKGGTVLSTFKNNAVFEGYADLPQIVGKGGNTKSALILSKIRGFDEIRERVQAYIRVADRRWDLKLKNGVRVRLPEHETIAALGELDRLQSEEQLLDRDILAVDLRLSDRTFVQLSEASAEEHHAHVEAIKGATVKAVKKRLGRPI